MKFKLTSLQTNETSDSTPDDKTHRLTFAVAEPSGAMPAMPTMLGSSTINLTITKAEAAAYTLGETYTHSLTAE